MAIVKANYTKQSGAAKASLRYIAHRPGRENVRITRTLWGSDGKMSRQQAYHLIDEAQEGSVFFRFVISPDPAQEDTLHDLALREITQATMGTLEERLGKPVSWVAAVHADHAPHRHVHVIAVVAGRLTKQDFPALTNAATEEARQQRRERDQAAQQKEQEREREEAQWER